MKLKKIIIFYPSFEKGGVEQVLINFINYILIKNYDVILVSSNFKKNLILKKKKFRYVDINFKKKFLFNDRISRSIIGFLKLREILSTYKKDSTIIFSLQSSVLSIIASKLSAHKIVVRNAEDPIYSTIYSENKLMSYLVLFLKLILQRPLET